MKKIIAILLLFTIFSCAGYEPIFSTKNFNFYIDEIEIASIDKISKKIEKKLKHYRLKKTDQKSYNLKINSTKKQSIVSKDSKGDPLIYELEIKSNIEIISDSKKTTNLSFIEKFNFNNQSNKFELNQYKKKIEENLINIINEKLIIKIQSI